MEAAITRSQPVAEPVLGSGTRMAFVGAVEAVRMADHTVLLTHRILAGGGPVLAAELADRLPGAEVVVADDDAETRDHLPTADILVTQRFDEEVLTEEPGLEWIQALSAGVDGYDLDSLADRGIILTNASGVHAEPIAEQILGYLLVFERNIHRGIHQQRDGVWERYFGGELADRTVGIVGLGAIGSRTAELCSALRMTVIGTKRDPTTAPSAADAVYGPDGLDNLLDRADYLVLTCPLTPETRGLIDGAALSSLSSDAVLVNIGRGELVDQNALVEALETDEIRGAALDVFDEEPLPEDSPLWDRRDVVMTPHMAGSTPHYWERCADIVAENYDRFRAGDRETLRNRIV